MTRSARITTVLLLITIVSKLIGFIRELTLLEAIGIGNDLDFFLIIYGISGLIMSTVGVSIMTNLTPIAHKHCTPEETLQILAEGVKIGAGLTLIAWLSSGAYLGLIAPGNAITPETKTLSLVIPCVVFFAIISEYQVAILLSRNNQFAIVSGNIIISAPLIILLLFVDIGIAAYSAGLVLSFALRSVIFSALIYKRPNLGFSWYGAFSKRSYLRENFWSIAAGGSAMMVVNFLFLICLLVAQKMGSGQASYFGYGLKIPMLVLTSIWFVFGSMFFSQIVAARGLNAWPKILRLTQLNFLMLFAMVLGVLAVIFLDSQIKGIPGIGTSSFLQIIQSSLPFLPLIVLIPIIEMTQRTLVTIDRHREVPMIAAAIVVSGCITILVAWVWSDAIILVLAMTFTLCIGAFFAFVKLRKLGLTTQKYYL